jgi:mannose-6-phosphate isomerase-like protein (cupin superfamily)
MTEFSVKRIEEMEGIGPRGVFKRARGELGVRAFGIAVIEMPPHADQYPEHSHAEDGQEEVYTAMSGSGEIEIEGVRHRIDPETMISVGPGVTRKVVTGDNALRLLIIGGVPGKAYDPPEFSKLGTPDPTKAQTA